MGALGLLLAAATAVVPFLAAVDAALARQVDAWRTCTGQGVFLAVSDAVRPLGLAALAAALLWRWRRDRAPWESLAVLAAVAGGTLLIDGLKTAVDRPRPGAEFLGAAGNSFPSGHVGNVLLCAVAVLALLGGRRRARRSVGGLLAVAAAVAVAAAARLYLGRHWASDALGTALLLGGYASLALLHDDGRWRAGAVAAAMLAAVALLGAGQAGLRLPLPTGSAASTTPPLVRIPFGAALAEGRLRGAWAPDGPDPRRRSAWMRSPEAALALAALPAGAAELRLVARPHPSGDATCRWLRVSLDGAVLGERLLHVGWRAYVFRLPPGPAGARVLSFGVRHERPEGRAGEGALVAFSELTLHPGRRSPRSEEARDDRRGRRRG